jgi:hypothetical protein
MTAAKFFAARRRDLAATAYSPNVGLVLAVIAAGNAREIVRLAEYAASRERLPGHSPHTHALVSALAGEALEFRSAVVTWTSPEATAPLTEHEKLALYPAWAA